MPKPEPTKTISRLMLPSKAFFHSANFADAELYPFVSKWHSVDEKWDEDNFTLNPKGSGESGGGGSDRAEAAPASAPAESPAKDCNGPWNACLGRCSDQVGSCMQACPGSGAVAQDCQDGCNRRNSTCQDMCNEKLRQCE